MADTRVVTISFRERLRNGRRVLAVAFRSDLDKNEKIVFSQVTLEQLDSIGQDLLGLLTSAVGRLKDHISDDAVIRPTVRKLVNNKFRLLADRGFVALNRIFDDDAQQIIKSLIGETDKVYLHIDSEQFVIPWELLYDNYDYAHFSFKNFWGYKYIIYRTIPPRNYSKDLRSFHLDEDQSVSVGLIADHNLTYVSGMEVPYLKELESQKLIKLFTPKKKLSPRSRNQLLAGELRTFFGQDNHVIHFACHTRRPKAHQDEPNDEYCLLLSKEFPLWPSNFFPYSKLPFGGDPLVILNACGTSPRHPRGTWSMVKTMLDNGAAGAISTEGDIPDVVAAFFIIKFYGLALKGMAIGDALFKVRKELLAAPYNNPFGLLYALYAHPQIRIWNNKNNQKERKDA
jgi:hypothetical protein